MAGTGGKTTNLIVALFGLVLAALGIPLVLELIPINGLYGFKTAKTESSDAVWYAANKQAGYALVVVGVILFVAALALRPRLATMAPRAAKMIHVALLLGSVVVVGVYSFIVLGRL